MSLRLFVCLGVLFAAALAPQAVPAKSAIDARFAACDPACIETKAYRGHWLLNFYDSKGDLIHFTETNVPVSFPLDKKAADLASGSLNFDDGVAIQDFNSDAPLPPPGGTGTVTETTTGSGTNDGVSGTWVITVTYTYVDGTLVRVSASSVFIPGPPMPDPPPTQPK
jgi:hypothetical protein